MRYRAPMRTVAMNPRQEPLAASHTFRVSHYGAHTSLVRADRIEMVDLLQDHLSTALDMLAQVKLGQQRLRNVSFIAVQQLFHRIASANLDYVEFITLRIRDLGGFTEPAMLMSALYCDNETRKSQPFGACIQCIHQGASQLCALGARLGFYRDRAIGGKDGASIRFIEECVWRTVCFTSLIQDNLPSGNPP
ncbi:hypothetical protein [Pseudomonas akapageensis]|uniref:hypothetical protein n=1 Tax=Pseudomonas akapageensis TaxID=2609961 RepID=UPI0014080688|nr:hypothetical protein [Pseudomonas akapageensis]